MVCAARKMALMVSASMVALFHAQQAVFHGGQLFAGFLGKYADDLFHADILHRNRWPNDRRE